MLFGAVQRHLRDEERKKNQQTICEKMKKNNEEKRNETKENSKQRN